MNATGDLLAREAAKTTSMTQGLLNTGSSSGGGATRGVSADQGSLNPPNDHRVEIVQNRLLQAANKGNVSSMA